MAGISKITLRIAARDIAAPYTVEDSLTVSSFFDIIAANYFLDRRYHILSLNENGKPPLPASKTLKEILSVRGFGCLFVCASSSAPLFARIPFMRDDELKKAAKKISRKIETGPDITGRTLLHLAAEYSASILKVLIRKKLGDPNMQDSLGNTPLMYAAKSGDVNRVKDLVAYGASAKGTNFRNENPLHFLAKNSSVSSKQCHEVIEFLASYDLNVYSRDKNSNTPAHTAVLYSNITALEYFVEHQYFRFVAANDDGDTCLHLAVRKRDSLMVQKILNLGGPKYFVNKEGQFPLDIAHAIKDEATARELSRDLETPLIIRVWDAIKEDNLEMAKFLNVRYRERVAAAEAEAAKKKGGGTMGRSSSVTGLGGTGNRGFRNSQSLYEGLPYHKIVNMACLWAAARFHLGILDYLLDEDAINFNFQNSDGSFLLYILCHNNAKADSPEYLAILQKCLRLGAHLNDRNISENCCLHIAALTGNKVAVKFLLDNGAFANSINSLGLSELHYAILDVPNLDILNELVKAGADYSYKLKSGLTVAEFAKKYGSPEASLILDSRCQQTTTNSSAQPNAAIVTLLRAENLLAKDENGFSDPYCVLTHRLDDLARRVETPVKHETLNPEWNETFTFVVRLENIFYRDVTIDVFDWDVEKEDLQTTHDVIGSALLVLDPRETKTDVSLEIRDQEGKAGNLLLSIEYVQLAVEERKKITTKEYEPYSAVATVKTMLKTFDTQSVGHAMFTAGFRPQFPVMIIPGLASSALEAWQTPKSAWLLERVWVDPFKIGKTAISMKLSNKIGGRKKKKEAKSRRSTRKVKASNISKDDSESDVEDLNADQRIWLRHILLAADGYSDPPGIKVRPVAGLAAVDFLATNPLARKATYVFGHVIHELALAGYTSKNLDAAPYDWRLPPQKLEERDHYFSTLRARIQLMRESNNERVVLMAHSMGNRTVQYFLKWVLAQPQFGQKWIDENVHAFFALGPPFLGATKTIRAVVSGDCMGLDVFLTNEEGRTMARGSGSLPWLFPIQEDLFPDTVARVRDVDLHASTGSSLSSDVVTDSFDGYDVENILKLASPLSLEYLNNFYKKNPLYGQGSGDDPSPPITDPPPVENLWVLYGVNLDTEVSYYFKKHKSISSRYALDSGADKYNNQKMAGINPRGLRVSGGIGYETKNTFQPSARANKSGDGTVPYCSLNYGSYWEELSKEQNIPLKNVRTTELEGAEHREMLNNPAVFEAIIQYVCRKKAN